MGAAVVSQNTLGRQGIVEKCLGTGSEDPSITLLWNNANKKNGCLTLPKNQLINLLEKIRKNLELQGTEGKDFSIKQTKKSDWFLIHSQLGILGTPDCQQSPVFKLLPSLTGSEMTFPISLKMRTI